MFNKLNKIVALAVISLSVSTVSTVVYSAEVKMEKCSGIVKVGKADGQATVKGKQVDWIHVPAGACMKLVGGKVILDK